MRYSYSPFSLLCLRDERVSFDRFRFERKGPELFAFSKVSTSLETIVLIKRKDLEFSLDLEILQLTAIYYSHSSGLSNHRRNPNTYNSWKASSTLALLKTWRVAIHVYVRKVCLHNPRPLMSAIWPDCICENHFLIDASPWTCCHKLSKGVFPSLWISIMKRMIEVVVLTFAVLINFRALSFFGNYSSRGSSNFFFEHE